MASRSNPSAEATRRLTLRAFMGSMDLSDLLVALGFFGLVIAGWRFHISVGIAILSAGLILIGVRAGRAA